MRISDWSSDVCSSDLAEIIAWVAGNVIPHEAALRARLRRMVVAGEEIDDIVQETYLNIARLKSVEHIRDGRGYLFTAARLVMLQRIRRKIGRASCRERGCQDV